MKTEGNKLKILGALCALVAIDRFFKQLIEQNFFDTKIIGWQWLALERHHNFGVAFNVPIPLYVVIPLTFLIIIGLVLWIRRHPHDFFAQLGASAVILGAISNLFDRIWYGYTVDYIRLINSIINIADLLVLAGIFLLVSRQKSD